MNQAQRIRYVGDLLVSRLRSVGLEHEIIPAVDWHQIVDFPAGKYGWTYPYPDPTYPDPTIEMFVVPCCTELIAYQTMPLDTATLDRYVYVIAWLANRFKELVYGDTPGGTLVEVDLDDIEDRLESDLYDHDPDLLQLLSRVQLTILDHTP